MNSKLITNSSVSGCTHAIPRGFIYERCLTRKLSVWWVFFVLFIFFTCAPHTRWHVKSKYSRRKTDMSCLSHPINTNSYLFWLCWGEISRKWLPGLRLQVFPNCVDGATVFEAAFEKAGWRGVDISSHFMLAGYKHQQAQRLSAATQERLCQQQKVSLFKHLQ